MLLLAGNKKSPLKNGGKKLRCQVRFTTLVRLFKGRTKTNFIVFDRFSNPNKSPKELYRTRIVRFVHLWFRLTPAVNRVPKILPVFPDALFRLDKTELFTSSSQIIKQFLALVGYGVIIAITTHKRLVCNQLDCGIYNVTSL